MSPARKALAAVPPWLRWVLGVCALVTAVGSAWAGGKGMWSDLEGYAPASRHRVRALRSWASSEHESLRAAQELDSAYQAAVLCGVNPKRAHKLGFHCEE